MTLNFEQAKLLDNLLVDEKKFDNKLYSAGPYWKYKTKKILYWLKKKGLNDFRGSDSGVGTSYTDNIVLDARNELGLRGRIIGYLTRLPFISKIYEEQTKLTSSYIKQIIKKNQIYYENNERVSYLISNYKIKNSVSYGCKSYFKNQNGNFSTHYLGMCDRIDNINNLIKLSDLRSYMEIGGGFGSNIHILIDNFKNLKKIIYVDIVPNIFVGTEYLRSIFGNSIKDYNLYRNEDEIKFSNDDNLEIICLPPWKIKNISSTVDHLHNAASFQEMTESVVKNYYTLIKKLLKKYSISLIVYKNSAKSSTLTVDQINKIFEDNLISKEFKTIDHKDQIYLLSK